MTRPLTFIAPVSTLLLAAALPAQEADTRALRVDSIFAAANRPGTPGAALVVVRDGRVLLERAYGYADLEHKVPVTPTTVFDVASVSKQFTGLAIAMLVEQGRIKLSDDVRKYIPELPNFGPTITIEHLVHHTSGIRDWPLTLVIAGWKFDDVISFDQILRMAYNQRTLNFTPGAEHTYSNTGYNLLAEVVQRVSGKPFRVYMDETIFRPLGMTSSHFHDDWTMVVENRAYGYGRVRPDVYRTVTNNLTALGSSSLFSTARDMGKWLANFTDAKVGGDAVRHRGTRARLNNGSTVEYAFGVVNGMQRGHANLNHSGSWAGFTSFVLLYPEQRFGVAVLANGGPTNVGLAANLIAGIYLEKEIGLFTPATAPAIATAPEVSVAPEVLDRYVGVYRLGPGWYVRIRRDGNTLRTQATREGEFPLSARSENEFWVTAYNSSMAFRPDSTTGVMTMLYRGRRAPRLASASPARRPLAELAGEYYSEELATSYVAVVKDTTIALEHRRHGSISLVHAWGDDYVSTILPSVEFQRDARGQVTGFAVLIDERSRNIRFTKR